MRSTRGRAFTPALSQSQLPLGIEPTDPEVAEDKGSLFPLPGNDKGRRSQVYAKNDAADLAWRWVQKNAPRTERRSIMKFCGWVIRTGTRRPEIVLALVKHFTVHRPRNVFAYYTPLGGCREIIAMRASADIAIAEHERIRKEEAEFFRKLGKR